MLQIYSLTKEFPTSENFGLTSQICRAAVSISSNIAEGFARYGKKEKIQFYYTALGSLTELQNQLLIARDVKYFDNDKFQETALQTVIVSKMINGLIKSLKKPVILTT